MVVLDDHGFRVRRDELDLAIDYQHGVKRRTRRHSIQGYIQRPIAGEGAVQVDISEREATAWAAAETEPSETAADGVHRAVFRKCFQAGKRHAI